MDEHAQQKRAILGRTKRVVIKIGSSLLSNRSGIDRRRLRRLVGEIQEISTERQVVVVSSGAVAAGMARLGLAERPKTTPQKQAAAAVGQIGLMALYERYFGGLGRVVAQVLLTHEDLANRRRYLNARQAFEALLQSGVVPIVNENDTVAVEEVHFGDNDNLSALVATLVSADLLVILSDVAGLFTANPNLDRAASLVPLVRNIDARIERYVGGSAGPLGTGGMATKLKAAHKAAQAGIASIIADGQHAGMLPRIFDPHESVGTLVLAEGDRLSRRKHWIVHTLRPTGSIAVDSGAYGAITRQGRSLLPKGITAIAGNFGAGECVSCLDPDGREFARGLTSYGAAEVAKIKGLHSNAIEGILGYKVSDEVIHRDHLVLV